MAIKATPGREVALETDRLLLRPWRVAEATVLRELWMERHPRVPPHRRLDAAGHPSVDDLEEWIRSNQPTPIGLLAVERKTGRDVIGSCGLLDSARRSVPPATITPPLTRSDQHRSAGHRSSGRATRSAAAE